jgi:hypothetical protein
MLADLGNFSHQAAERVVGQFSISVLTRHYRNVGYIKEMRIIDAERREFQPIFSVTVSSNEAQHMARKASLSSFERRVSTSLVRMFDSMPGT